MQKEQYFKSKPREFRIDKMDFDQPITPDFNADEIDIFAELGAPSSVQPASSNPLDNILLEEEEHETPEFDPVLVAELLQVLAQHNIRQQSEEGFDALPELSLIHI